MANSLSKKQNVFIAEYLTDFNATRSYIAAGYSKNGAEVSACKLLRNPKVAAEIERRTEKRIQRLEITADGVLQELAKLGFSNMQDYVQVQDGEAFIDLSKVSREQFAAVQEITVEEYTEGRGEEKRDIKRTKFKLGDKRGSLELLGKHLKLFTDKVEHAGTVTYKPADLSQLSDEELAIAEKLVESAAKGT